MSYDCVFAWHGPRSQQDQARDDAQNPDRKGDSYAHEKDHCSSEKFTKRLHRRDFGHIDLEMIIDAPR
jgi:hypothetical protein